MKVVFHEEALDEMLGSASYYEETVEGLGWDFLKTVEQTTERIVAFPEAGPMVGGTVRKRGLPIHVALLHRTASGLHRGGGAPEPTPRLLAEARSSVTDASSRRTPIRPPKKTQR